MSSTPPALSEALPDLPQPDQIGFVVKDLNRAIALYEPLFGPFTVPDFSGQTASYRGAEPTPFELKFAFGRAGDIEIELIEWIEGATPHRDFIQRGGEGMHHLRYRIDDLDVWLGRVRGLGYEEVWSARPAPGIGYAYCERAGDPLVLEFLQLPKDLG